MCKVAVKKPMQWIWKAQIISFSANHILHSKSSSITCARSHSGWSLVDLMASHGKKGLIRIFFLKHFLAVNSRRTLCQNQKPRSLRTLRCAVEDLGSLPQQRREFVWNSKISSKNANELRNKCLLSSPQFETLLLYISYNISCNTFILHSYFHIPQFNFDFLTKHSSNANRIPRLLTSSMIWLSSSLSTDSIWFDQCIQIPHTLQRWFQTIHQVWSESALVCEQTSLVCLTSLCARHWSAPRRSACGPTFGHKIEYNTKQVQQVSNMNQTCCCEGNSNQ